jgi:hypothetical protein
LAPQFDGQCQDLAELSLGFALDRETSEADHHDLIHADENLDRIIQALSNLTRKGLITG